MKPKNKNTFLSPNTSSDAPSQNSSLAIIAFESIGFIVVGAVMLYLSTLQSDVLFYVLIGLAIASLAIGLHIFFALVIACLTADLCMLLVLALYLTKSKHR